MTRVEALHNTGHVIGGWSCNNLALFYPASFILRSLSVCVIGLYIALQLRHSARQC